MQSTSWETLGWKKHKLESRLLGEISVTSNNADDTTLMAESEEELKGFLMKVKEESGKVGLKLSIQKTKIMASGYLCTKTFLSSYVYSCYLVLISSTSVRSVLFLSFFVSIFAWNVPLVSLIFLNRSLVFPILLFSSISLYSSLKTTEWSLFHFQGKPFNITVI